MSVRFCNTYLKDSWPISLSVKNIAPIKHTTAPTRRNAGYQDRWGKRVGKALGYLFWMDSAAF
jgi:hypothetical protein